MSTTVTTAETMTAEPTDTYELSTDDGLIVLHVDRIGEDVWLEAEDGYSSAEMLEMLAQAEALGIVPLRDDEEPAELTETGVRRYCSSV